MLGIKAARNDDQFLREASLEDQSSTRRRKLRNIDKKNPQNVVNKSVLYLKNLRMQQIGQEPKPLNEILSNKHTTRPQKQEDTEFT